MTVQTDTGNRLTGFFRGTVLKRCTQGKIKCFIYGVYPEEYKEDPSLLPDCEQASPLFGGVLMGNGMYSYPNIGATVWCFFANEDQNQPVYFAATLGMAEGAGQFKSCEPYPDDEKGAYFHKICCGKSEITMSELGNVVIENHSINYETNEPRDTVIIMDQGGNIQINSTKTLNIETESLKLKASKTIQIETDELAIKANNRTVLKTPYFSVNNNYDGVNYGENGTTINSDTINLNCEKGYISVQSKTNGSQSL